MAWRAILRRHRFIDQCINSSNTSIPNSHSLARGFSTHVFSSSEDLINSYGKGPMHKDNPHKFSGLGFFKSRFFGVTNCALNPPIGLRWIHQTQKVRPFSTEVAVEGLTIEAKAKAKLLRESQKDDILFNDETLRFYHEIALDYITWLYLCNMSRGTDAYLPYFVSYKLRKCLRRDYDMKVTLEDVASVVMYVKATLVEVDTQELISSLSKGYEYKEKHLEFEELNEDFKHEEEDLESEELNKGLEHAKEDLESKEFIGKVGQEKKDLEFEELNEGFKHEEKDLESEELNAGLEHDKKDLESREEFIVKLGYEEKDLESEESIRDLYDRWRTRHPRKFRNLREKTARFNIFKANLKRIHKINQMNLWYKEGLTLFADWTDEEIECIKNNWPLPTTHIM